MKEPVDLARQYLTLADRDLVALRLLAPVDAIADETVGFHAQQAVEKSLKAVLTLHRVEFRKIHDLEELLRLLDLHALPGPPHAEYLVTLTPYAVLLRYAAADSAPLDRRMMLEVTEAVQAWAVGLIG